MSFRRGTIAARGFRSISWAARVSEPSRCRSSNGSHAPESRDGGVPRPEPIFQPAEYRGFPRPLAGREIRLSAASAGSETRRNYSQAMGQGEPCSRPVLHFSCTDCHAPPSPGAEAWMASAWTPPSSSPTSVSLIMRWRSSRLFPRNAAATICTLK
jgi:hypothetical protein